MLSKEQIQKINRESPPEQGVFQEPYGIPVHIKEPVIYFRRETGGVSGGSCWDTSNPQPYTNYDPVKSWVTLDLVIKELFPTLSYLQFKEIESLIHTNQETEFEYYGNCTEYEVKYIKTSDLYNCINSLKVNENAK